MGMKGGRDVPKTRITIVTGESYEIDIDKETFINEITNGFGSIFNEVIKIDNNVSIVTSHIVKIEKIDNLEEKLDDEDSIVYY
jgi:hypothetical protein